MILAASTCDTYRVIESYARNPGNPKCRLRFDLFRSEVYRQTVSGLVTPGGDEQRISRLIEMRLGPGIEGAGGKGVVDLSSMSQEELKAFYIKAVEATGKKVDPAVFGEP